MYLRSHLENVVKLLFEKSQDHSLRIAANLNNFARSDLKDYLICIILSLTFTQIFFMFKFCDFPLLYFYMLNFGLWCYMVLHQN